MPHKGESLMTAVRWTSLILALLLIPTVALAAVRAPSAQCVVTFELKLDGAVPDPFGRWLGELADITVLTLDRAEWDEGEGLRLRLRLNQTDAFEFTLFSQDEGIWLASDLMGEGAVILDDKDAKAASGIIAGLSGSLLNENRRSTRRLGLSAGYVADVLQTAAWRLNRWGEAASETMGSVCVELGQFIDALRELIEALPEGRELLRLNISYFQPDEPLEMPDKAMHAPQELSGILTYLAAEASVYAIAGVSAPEAPAEGPDAA